MKKIILPLATGLIFFQCAMAQQAQSANCSPPTAMTDLDISNVRAKIFCGGDMWWDLVGSARYEVPKGSGKHSMFAGAIWMGAFDNSHNLRVAAQTYRLAGSDFWPGPIDTAVTSATCQLFDRHWKINKTDVQNFAAGGNATPEIMDYPANGITHPLAPYFDRNNDGIYDYNDGDYPLFDDPYTQSGCNCSTLHGDQVLWWVINDVGNVHGKSMGAALGVEIQCQAYAFVTNDEDINNSTFYEYKIINRNTTTSLDSTWFGFFADADLGNYLDDYVGCDVGRGLAYAYNGDENDEGISGYGFGPPAIGVDFIKGPDADVGDNIDNDRDSCTDCTFMKDSLGNITDTIPDTVLPERIKMSKFVYYNNNNDPINGNPNSADDFFGYLQGIWRNGSPMTYGGNGHGGGVGGTPDLCDFMYPGNSDPWYWGTDGLPEANWDEVTALNAPDDRRFLTSVGPFTMLPGAVQCIQTAVIWARDTMGRLYSLEKLKRADDKIDPGPGGCFHLSIGIGEIGKATANIFPNPVNDQLTISIDQYLKDASVAVYDASGKLMMTQNNLHGNSISISCSNFTPGIYFYQVRIKNVQVATGRFMKE